MSKGTVTFGVPLGSAKETIFMNNDLTYQACDIL
jgi:hypothetical protein